MTNESDTQLLEAATKKKRGRPPLYSETFKSGMAVMFPDVSERTLINYYFAGAGHGIATNLLGKDEADKRFINNRDDLYHGWKAYRYQGVLEQIGRMYLQDHFDEDLCKDVMSEAIDIIDSGEATSKSLEREIRGYRRRLRNAYKEAATENQE